MPLDGFTSKFLAKEIAAKITGGRIDKILQPSNHVLILQIRNLNTNFRLIFNANPQFPYFNLIDFSLPNPPQAPNFCMFLRKHLATARIISFTTNGLERQIILKVEHVNEMGDSKEKSLIFELMGRHSNIIFINDENIILDAITHVDNSMSRIREVLPAHPYVMPPKQNKLDLLNFIELLRNPDSWSKIHCEGENKIGKFILNNLQGSSPFMINGILNHINVDKNSPVESLNQSQRQALIDFFTSIDNDTYKPTIYHNIRQNRYDLHCFDMDVADSAKVTAPDLITALNKINTIEEKKLNLLNKKHELSSICQNRCNFLKKKIAILEKDYRESANYAQYKLYGQLILDNLYLITPEMEEISVINYYSEAMEKITLPLARNIKPSDIAGKYFKKYNKNYNRYISAGKYLDESKDELAYIESLLISIENSDTLNDLAAISEEMNFSQLIKSVTKEKIKNRTVNHNPLLHPGKPGNKKKNKFKNQTANNKKTAATEQITSQPLKYQVGDFTILVGRNNLQNDQLTLRTAKNDDIWFHRKDVPGAHVILRTNGTVPPESVILTAAEICAWYSIKSINKEQIKLSQKINGNNKDNRKDLKDLGEKIAVDYCPIQNVSKPKGAKPGRVIYKEYQTVFVKPYCDADDNINREEG